MVLGIIGVINIAIISAATLATLGLLANSLLNIRRYESELKHVSIQLNSEIKSLQVEIQGKDLASKFLSQNHSDLSYEIKQAKRISILGTSLVSTINRYYSEFKNLAENGNSLRFLLSEPTPEIVKMLAFRSNSITEDTDLFMSTVQHSIARVIALEKSATKPEQIQLKVIPYIPANGLIIVEMANGNAKIYVKIMSFQASTVHFELSNITDDMWFKFYFEQFEKLWKASSLIQTSTALLQNDISVPLTSQTS